MKTNYTSITIKLKNIRTRGTPLIVHTNPVGARGIDFDISGGAHVIIGFKPCSGIELTQALGRGARSCEKRAVGTIVYRAEPNH